MTRKSNVIQIFESLKKLPEVSWPPKTWEMTPKRKLAIERNWNYRILACMEALCEGPLQRFGVSQAVRQQLLRAIATARYGVDASYYDQLEELERKEKRNAPRR